MLPCTRSDDDVEQAGFVLHVEEGHSPCCPRSLSVGDDSSNFYTPSSLDVAQPVNSHHTSSIKDAPDVANRMVGRTDSGGTDVVTQ